MLGDERRDVEEEALFFCFAAGSEEVKTLKSKSPFEVSLFPSVVKPAGSRKTTGSCTPSSFSNARRADAA